MNCLIWCCNTLSYVSLCAFSQILPFLFIVLSDLSPFVLIFRINQSISQSGTVFLTIITSKDWITHSGELRCLLTTLGSCWFFYFLLLSLNNLLEVVSIIFIAIILTALLLQSPILQKYVNTFKMPQMYPGISK